MPIERKAWGCQYGCGRSVLTSKKGMIKHEQKCFHNPTRRACVTCGNFGYDYETVYNPYHGGNPGSTDYECKYTFCKADIDIEEKLKHDCESWVAETKGDNT